jgi:hypothetical protein
MCGPPEKITEAAAHLAHPKGVPARNGGWESATRALMLAMIITRWRVMVRKRLSPRRSLSQPLSSNAWSFLY